MKYFSISSAVILTLAVASVSCDKIKPPQPQLQPAPAATEQSSQQKETRSREEFTQASQRTLDELRDAIAGFKAKAETANVEAKAKLGEEVTKLETELQEAQLRLTELKAATLESWVQLKESFGHSLDKLKNAVDKFGKNAT